MQELLTPDFGDYELIDSGGFEKLERFGGRVLRRPEPQAIWRPTLPEEEWRRVERGASPTPRSAAMRAATSAASGACARACPNAGR